MYSIHIIELYTYCRYITLYYTVFPMPHVAEVNKNIVIVNGLIWDLGVSIMDSAMCDFAVCDV